MKKIAVVNDISGFGKCSLTAAIPIISALKVQACPLPTSVLSNQTCYDSFYMKELTNDMDPIIEKWLELGFSFDGIYSGFLSREEQVSSVVKLVENFKTDGVKYILDPVMGDDGKPYANYSSKLRDSMLYLAEMADILLPNVTELALLSGIDSKEFLLPEGEANEEKVKETALCLAEKTGTTVVVTGVSTPCDMFDFGLIGNIIADYSGKVTSTSIPKLGCRGYSGTGDIMASIVAAMTVRGFDIREAVIEAASFIGAAILQTAVKEQTDVNDGIAFERILGDLTKI